MTDTHESRLLAAPAPTGDLHQARSDLDEFGVAIVSDMLPADRVAELRQRLVEQAAGERAAGVLEGDPDSPITYIRPVIGKGQVFHDLATEPQALETVRHVLGDDITLFSFVGNAVGPGAPGGGAHTDQMYLPWDTPRPVVCIVIYMLDDFTEENGATLVVPGSHRRSFEELTPEQFAAEAVPATGPAGSALIMESRVFHSIGVNRTSDNVRHALLAAYSVPFLRPQYNWSLSFPAAMIDDASPELRELLGFRMWRGLGRAGVLTTEDGRPAPRRHDAHTSDAKMDLTKVKPGWVSTRPDFVRALNADGTPVP